MIFAVDFFFTEPIHLEAKTKEELVEAVRDFNSLYVWPVKSATLITEPILGGEYIEVVPVSDEHGMVAFEVKEVKNAT